MRIESFFALFGFLRYPSGTGVFLILAGSLALGAADYLGWVAGCLAALWGLISVCCDIYLLVAESMRTIHVTQAESDLEKTSQCSEAPTAAVSQKQKWPPAPTPREGASTSSIMVAINGDTPQGSPRKAQQAEQAPWNAVVAFFGFGERGAEAVAANPFHSDAVQAAKAVPASDGMAARVGGQQADLWAGMLSFLRIGEKSREPPVLSQADSCDTNPFSKEAKSEASAKSEGYARSCTASPLRIKCNNNAQAKTPAKLGTNVQR